MNDTNLAAKKAKSFVDWLQALKLPAEPSDEHLRVVAAKLRELARASAWANCPFRAASPGEQLKYELAISTDEDPLLYVVSDCPTVVSPPHNHDTWVVIAGIRGYERNHRYLVRSTKTRTVSYDSAVDVGPGDTLTLQGGEVHSTQVISAQATFHLHLYGRSLRSLPSLESRSYHIVNDYNRNYV